MTKSEAHKIIRELDSKASDQLKELLTDLVERTHREAPHAKKKKAPAKAKAAPAV